MILIRKWSRAAPWTLVKFGIVGGLGYAVYQTMLFATYDWGVLRFLPQKHDSINLGLLEHGDARLLISTLLAAEVAIILVFTGHTLWTFRGAQTMARPILLRLAHFHTSQVISFAIGITIINVLTVQFGLYHFISAPIGTAAAAAWNLVFSIGFVWRQEAGARSQP